LRKINEQHAAKKALEAKPKGLTRNMSLLTVSLKGHLFDSQCFNMTIDACEKNSLQFRVLKWDIGNSSTVYSKVAIQLMAKDKNALNETLDKIEEIAAECNVDLYQGEEEDDEDHKGYEGMLDDDVLEIEKN